jgi:hypothetical protein
MEHQVPGRLLRLSDALLQFAMQLSGALGIPLTRLLGQSPKGLGNEGESDMQNYYDGISQQQNRTMHSRRHRHLQVHRGEQGITLDDDFASASPRSGR